MLDAQTRFFSRRAAIGLTFSDDTGVVFERFELVWPTSRSLNRGAREAGLDINTAVFYPDDEQFLIERDLTVDHYEVAGTE